MKDKNGIEIKTGMVVRISGAYFKNDNGLYLVTHSAGDPGWLGKEYGLQKIRRDGKEVARHSTSFWPLANVTNNRYKNACAFVHNSVHAEIEVVSMGNAKDNIFDYFERKLRSLDQELDWIKYNFGKSGEYDRIMKIYNFMRGVASEVAQAS